MIMQREPLLRICKSIDLAHTFICSFNIIKLGGSHLYPSNTDLQLNTKDSWF